jgi:hypothetical protein
MDWAEELNSSYGEYSASNPSNFFGRGVPKRERADQDDAGHATKRAKPASALSDQEMKLRYEKETLNKVRCYVSSISQCPG